MNTGALKSLTDAEAIEQFDLWLRVGTAHVDVRSANDFGSAPLQPEGATIFKWRGRVFVVYWPTKEVVAA